MRTWILALALGVAGLSPAHGQIGMVICGNEQTVAECYGAVRPVGGAPPTAADSARASALTAAATDRLQGKATGADLSSAGSLSAINDFLPRLAASLVAPTTGGSPDFGFKTNLPLNDGMLFRLGTTLQFATVFHEAKLSNRFADSLSAATRSTLEGGLGVFEDAQITASLNLENRRFGRRIEQHRDAVQRIALALASRVPSGPRLDAAEAEFRDLRRSMGDDVLNGVPGVVRPGSPAHCRIRSTPAGPGVPGFSDLRVSCLTEEARLRVERGISAISEAAAQYIRERDEQLRESGFTHLSQLVNNQPQFNASWEYDARRSLVGPSEWTGRTRFELGFANMNGLRRHCGGAVDAACLRRYVNDPSVRGSMARADRVFAQVEFTRRSAWHVSVPQDTFELRLAGATTLAVSAGYGAYFGNPDDGENRDRLDLQGKYDFTGDDPVRENRFVGTLFYTRRVSDQASAVFGLTWANHPEFLGDVTRKLGANVGFTYKLNSSDQ
jgi:hypothetical protein